MGGGGGGLPHDIPDWKSYKAEGIPELDRLQKRLSANGLRDPWIRNEVWRYMDRNGKLTYTWQKEAYRSMFRGLGMAVVAMGLTIAYDKLTRKDDDHGHH